MKQASEHFEWDEYQSQRQDENNLPAKHLNDALALDERTGDEH